MTDERFILKKCKLYDVVYNKDVPIATFKNVDDADVICSWLNELYDQNVQLLIQKTQLQEKNEQLKNELRKEKSLREYSDSMYGADLIVNIRFSKGEWKADVSVIDDE